MSKTVKTYEGLVEYNRHSDTGYPNQDFDYRVGYDYVTKELEKIISKHEDEHVRLTFIVEEIQPEEESEDDDY